MGLFLLLAFIIVPIVEIGLFISVGSAIGLFPTLAVVILTAIAGTILVRSQGLMVLQNIRTSSSKGELPAEQLVHGAMILFSGALLLTPGFFTDAVGFLLLVPTIRHFIYKYAAARINVASVVHNNMSHSTHRRQADDVVDLDENAYRPADKKDN